MKADEPPQTNLPLAPSLYAACIDTRTDPPTVIPQQGLHARFIWDGDRYLHRLEVGDAAPLAILQSRRDDREPEWPADPPLQQLSIETLGEQMAALGVGAAGTSHWSLSIEAIAGPAPAFRYDLACRTRLPPRRLGSTFEMLATEGRFAIRGSEGVLIDDLAGGQVRIVEEPSIGPVQWQAVDGGGGLQITADLASDDTPGTYRWGFRVIWEPRHD